jgi:DNA-binding GntR family transcriptional regulator
MVTAMFREKSNLHASRDKRLSGAPLRMTSLVQVACDLLLDAIFDSRLNPGQIYNQSVIAREMGMSTTPVHEALTILAGKGLIEIVPRRGVRLTELGRVPFNGLFEFRRLLEHMVAFKVVPPLTDAQLNHLHALCIDCGRQTDVSGCLRADEAVHNYLASLTGNYYVINALADVSDQWHWIGQRILEVDGGMDAWRQYHRKMHACMTLRDPQGTWRVREQHLNHTERRFKKISNHKKWIYEQRDPIQISAQPAFARKAPSIMLSKL